MQKKILISIVAILIFGGGALTSWLIFGQKKNETQEVVREVSENSQTSKENKPAQGESQKIESSTTQVANSARSFKKLIKTEEGIRITHPDQLAFLNISDQLKEYITKEVEHSGVNDYGCKVLVSVRIVYGDYMIGGIGGHSLNPSLQCGGGAIIIAGLKNGKVERLGGGHAAPSCAEKATWNLPAEFAKHVECQ